MLAALRVALVLLLMLPAQARPDELTVPLTLDYRILAKAFAEQLFQGPEQSARLYSDTAGCNSLQLAHPRIDTDAFGRIRILSDIDARIGTPAPPQCLFPLQWQAVLDTRLEVYPDAGGKGLDFRVVDSDILKADEQTRTPPGVLWNWIKGIVHPRLETVSIDLSPTLAGLDQLMQLAVSPEKSPVAISLQDVEATPRGLRVQLALQVPPPVPDQFPPELMPLTEEELARWDAAWQAWDGFATWLIKTMAVSAGPELANALADLLLEARYDLRDALALEDHTRDPVRDLFLKTWERLAPLLHDRRLNIPGADALQFATFVSAADALAALDQAAPHLGLVLDRNSLRSMARLLVPGVSDDNLRYGTEIDPALRTLLGLEPELSEEPEPPLSPFAWLIPVAQAGPIDPVLVTELTGWVPTAAEIDTYLSTLSQLLDQVISTERQKAKVPVAYFEIYANALRTTAWQESCWRQFIRSGSEVKTIQSSGGALGLMQINRHVWRGVYNIDSLSRDIGYNARAGNEILVHYMVDIAIKKKEHQITGNPLDLARATYAVYNGGPGHLSRYRKDTTKQHLRAIDAEFWKKYQAMAQQGPAAVKACYGA
ncbi:hypothetical protein GCM10011348_11170 [Marinobacterium nitratireducens]|uniref:Transglycosylase SLT domain-containing protein n=1 Tax=Marinobacterium nitratireducens TaxID=518897 RepID=A0A918DQW7_9GAMM|nr:transglycosylase SLT domain-containing protein [Marinobacterium nitratireducens]GGO78671.1 hypothetical protein GCM10011348_11170 [Marinobacterium nitratireducens]